MAYCSKCRPEFRCTNLRRVNGKLVCTTCLKRLREADQQNARKIADDKHVKKAQPPHPTAPCATSFMKPPVGSKKKPKRARPVNVQDMTKPYYNPYADLYD